jgi:hypothetical protein
MINRQLGINRRVMSIFGYFFLICVLLNSCKQKEDLQYDALYGKWDITRAEKNGKETTYLRNGYFVINANGTMTVNITGEDENGSYQVEKGKLVMEGDKIFDIQSLQGDSLTVRYSIPSGTEFLIFMQKNKEDAQ